MNIEFSRNYFNEYKKIIITIFASLLMFFGYTSLDTVKEVDATYQVKVKMLAGGNNFTIKVEADGQTGTNGPYPGWTTWDWTDAQVDNRCTLLDKWRRNVGAWEKTNFYMQSNRGNYTYYNTNNSTHGFYENWGNASQTSYVTKF